MGAHLIDGDFQSDKYPTTPRGKVPLSVRDVTAQDLLYAYAQRRRLVDAEFADDLEAALERAGYRLGPAVAGVVVVEASLETHVIPRDEVRLVTVNSGPHPTWILTYVLVNDSSRSSRSIMFGKDLGCEIVADESIFLQNASAARMMMMILTRGQHDLRIAERDDGWHVQGVDGSGSIL